MEQTLSENFWDGFDFFAGKTEYISCDIKEDMLLLSYPGDIMLDVGFYGDVFRAAVIKNHDWNEPVVCYCCKDINGLSGIIAAALERLRELI